MTPINIVSDYLDGFLLNIWGDKTVQVIDNEPHITGI